MFRPLMIQGSLFLYFSSCSPVPNVSFSHLACGFDVINIGNILLGLVLINLADVLQLLNSIGHGRLNYGVN